MEYWQIITDLVLLWVVALNAAASVATLSASLHHSVAWRLLQAQAALRALRMSLVKCTGTVTCILSSTGA